jgi:hypothetical protein
VDLFGHTESEELVEYAFRDLWPFFVISLARISDLEIELFLKKVSLYRQEMNRPGRITMP